MRSYFALVVLKQTFLLDQSHAFRTAISVRIQVVAKVIRHFTKEFYLWRTILLRQHCFPLRSGKHYSARPFDL